MLSLYRVAVFLAVGIAAGVVVIASAGSQSTQPTAKTVVIVELFTSEGCSSCPPADDLLRRLIATQPLEGVEILALGSHVDYWNHDGWRDPFSSALFSERQSAYDAVVFRSNQVYTPQLVVDGALQALGNDAALVRQALLRAAAQPKATVTVTTAPEGHGRERVDVQVDAPTTLQRHRGADIVVAVTEDGLVSHVGGGENGGRTLSHSAVVRSLTIAGRLNADARTASASVVVPIAPEWASGNLRIVGFVQEQASRRIFGGGSSPCIKDR